MKCGAIQYDELVLFLFLEYVKNNGKDETIRMMKAYGFDEGRIHDLFFNGK